MKVKITILGNVHNVGYRPFLLDLADSLFIDKFDARNVTVNGKQAVIVLVEGDERTVKQFVELVRKEKPENAVVEDVRIEEFDGLVRSIESYRQSLMVNQLNKIVHVGLQMLEKQDETIKVIKEEGEKTRKVLGEKIDETRNELTQEIREFRIDMKSYIDERLKNMESEIKAIKSKLGMA